MEQYYVGDLPVERYPWAVVDANSYLLRDGNNALLIDAVASEDLCRALIGIEHLSVILTHSHFDHISGLNKVRELIPHAEVISTERCSAYLGDPHRNMSATANVFMMFYTKSNTETKQIAPFACAAADIVFENELSFQWNDHDILLSAVHGHTDDSLIALLDKHFLFSGDTLLPIPTATRFPTGRTRRFWEEDMPRLRAMASETTVFPGHGMPGPIQEMLAVNHIPAKYMASAPKRRI